MLAVRIVSDRSVRSGGCSRPVVPFDGLPVPDAVGGLELLCPPEVSDVFMAGGLFASAPLPADATRTERHKISDSNEITCISCGETSSDVC